MGTKIINYEHLWQRICNWSRKAGRTASRPILLMYYVMTSKKTPKKDKVTIFAAISYLVLPIDILSSRRLPIIGWLDEVVSLAVTIQKMQKHITPEMLDRADEMLDRWFPEYAEFEEIEMLNESTKS